MSGILGMKNKNKNEQVALVVEEKAKWKPYLSLVFVHSIRLYFYFDFITNYNHKRLCSIPFRPFHMENVVYTFIHLTVSYGWRQFVRHKVDSNTISVQLTHFPFYVSVFTLCSALAIFATTLYSGNDEWMNIWGE